MLTHTEAGRRSVPAKMVASVPNVVTFFTFLFIIVSTFAILGMQVTGFCTDNALPGTHNLNTTPLA